VTNVFELTPRGRVTVLHMTHGKANAMDLEFCRALSAQVQACQQSAAGALVIT
jgi:enoyl-CoA hydratase/carnithine racemase